MPRQIAAGRLVKFTHPKTNLEAYGVLRRAAQHKVTGDALAAGFGRGLNDLPFAEDSVFCFPPCWF